MSGLIRAEFFKLKKYMTSITYLLMLVVYAASEIMFTRNEISIGVLHTGVFYTGAEWFYRMPAQVSHYMSSLFLFAAVYVAAEFTNRTFSASFWCGFARKKVLWAKVMAFYMGLIPFLVVHAVTGTTIWTIQCGFGREFNMETALFLLKTLVYLILGFLVFGTIGFLFAVLTRSRIATVAVSWVTVYILGVLSGNAEYIPVTFISKTLMFFFHFTIFDQLGQLNGIRSSMQVSFGVSVISSIVWVVFMLLLASHHLEKRDLK